jgi:predicted ATPase/DNA-binding winged helix-turn-helix (wHTH) protein
MGPPSSSIREFSFGPFYLHATERRLLRDGATVEIGSRALDILIALVEGAGEVIGKKGLIARVWPDVIVEESSLRVHVAALRKALGDGVDGARYITNVPGRGYSFVAPVSSSTTTNTAESAAPSNATAAAAPVAEHAHARVTHTLPARLTRMVGRDSAIAALSQQLRAERFVTIVGPGGLGKTTVAVSVAHLLSAEFTTAVFVDLAAVTDGSGVAHALAATLGLTIRKEDPIPEILAFLRENSMLLVLDNCEHVVQSIGAIAELIFVEAPRVYILATSRELLNVEGERVYALEPLGTPDTSTDMTAARALEYPAVQLFLERAGATAGPIELSDADAPVVAEICRRLDGIALAVELAAGRVSVFGIRGTADLLEKQLALAWRGRRTALPRHQTLSATLDWSYSLLSEDEKLVLRRLSIFMGEFSLSGALSVVSEPEEDSVTTIEMIASLVAKSLISMRITAGQPRYRLLEMVRAYALLRLTESGESKLIAARHARYFAIRCREAEAADSTNALDSRDLGNIRSALEWSFSEQGDASIARDLSVGATSVLLRWSLLAECRIWSSRALERLQDSDRDSIHESQLIKTLAISTIFTLGNQESVRVQMERGLQLARTFGDQRGQFEFHTGMHAFSARTGNFPGARDAAAAAAEVANEVEIASAHWMLGMALHLGGDTTQALASCDVAMTHPALAAATRKRYFGYDQRTPGLAVRARLLWLKGHTDQALQVATQAIDEGAELKHPVSYCLTLLYATSVYLWSERWVDAEHAIERLVDSSRNYSLEPYFAGGKMLQGELLHCLGDHESAIPLLRDAAQRLNRERQVAQAPYCSAMLADALGATGQFAPALDVLEQAIAQREAVGSAYDMPEMMRIKGKILLGMGNRDAARDCLRKGIELARSEGTPSWQAKLERAMAQLPTA